MLSSQEKREFYRAFKLQKNLKRKKTKTKAMTQRLTWKGSRFPVQEPKVWDLSTHISTEHEALTPGAGDENKNTALCFSSKMPDHLKWWPRKKQQTNKTKQNNKKKHPKISVAQEKSFVCLTRKKSMCSRGPSLEQFEA